MQGQYFTLDIISTISTTTLKSSKAESNSKELTMLLSKATAKINWLAICFGMNTTSSASKSSLFNSGRFAIMVFAAL
jgi:hypothetical protein